MRLAVLSEIHANQEALLAVLEDLRTQEKNGAQILNHESLLQNDENYPRPRGSVAEQYQYKNMK
ncbi:MAG: hypothetical protein RBT36_10530 [Desulfobulbus sp.]|jgi:hypothetical protein|nr:hypothetical protein [Desulfobulbus sp.]